LDGLNNGKIGVVRASCCQAMSESIMTLLQMSCKEPYLQSFKGNASIPSVTSLVPLSDNFHN
jgi:hypothetical protein